MDAVTFVLRLTLVGLIASQLWKCYLMHDHMKRGLKLADDVSILIFLLRVSVVVVCDVLYCILFPSRAGDTSRVSFADRLVLACRLAVSRLLIVALPFRYRTAEDVARFMNSRDTQKRATAEEQTSAKVLVKLMTAESAVRTFILPYSVLYFSGFAASESPCVWSHAIRKVATETQGAPASSAASSSCLVVSQLTIITQSGSSTRGVGSAAIDNVITDTPRGTVKRLIAGHLETCVGTLKKVDLEKDVVAAPADGDDGGVELYNIPLGVISRLVRLQTEPSTVAAAAQRNGLQALSELLHPRRLDSTVGVRSFLEHNRGKLTKNCKLDLAIPRNSGNNSSTTSGSCCGEGETTSILYGMPSINVALIHARFADQHGNAHFSEATVIGDAMAAARAAKRNGGRVLVSVQEIRHVDTSLAALAASPLVLGAEYVDAISHVSSVLLHDFSGLARHCRLPKSVASAAPSTNGDNKTGAAAVASSSSVDREEILELWERASLGFSYATTFHARWRDARRDSAVISHAHDEVLRLAKLLTAWKQVPVIRVLIGVSLPELVVMRLAESGYAFLGADVTDRHLVSTSPFALRDENAVMETIDRERDALMHQKQQSGGDKRLMTSVDEAQPCLQFVVESGVVGGLPATGFLFGAAFHPHRILEGPAFWGSLSSSSSSNFVHMCVLGAGEVDVKGCVNVSRGGDTLRDVIGCGGFPDIVDGTAYAIVIVVSLQSAGTRFKRQHGTSIVQQVREVTFDPLRALRNNVSVRYCTEFGVFRAELYDGATATRLVAPPGLEMLVQQKCKIQLILE